MGTVAVALAAGTIGIGGSGADCRAPATGVVDGPCGGVSPTVGAGFGSTGPAPAAIGTGATPAYENVSATHPSDTAAIAIRATHRRARLARSIGRRRAVVLIRS
jgi:hypothetical protein